MLIALVLVVTALAFGLLWRALVAECLDPLFLRSESGMGTVVHFGFLALVVLNLVAGFQALGTLLAVGLMILPVAAAHFWTQSARLMVALAVAIGAVSSAGGMLLSCHLSLPSGPAITLSAGAAYVVSVLSARAACWCRACRSAGTGPRDPRKRIPMILRSLAALMLSAVAVQAGPPQVVATFSIIGDMAARVGGDRIELQVLVGPDADAHVYEPRPRDAMAVARANVVLTNGLALESFVDRLIAASGTDAAIVALTDGADVPEDPAGGHYQYVGDQAIWHAGAHDPHAWQSVPNARACVATIAGAFCAADAEGCEVYRANAARYAKDLNALDAEIRTAIGALPEDCRTVVVAHNAFRYFSEEYGIAFLSPQGTSTAARAAD
ncbi:hypothetical protein E4L95_06885 [Paracoccus liaowanqingii]|uniref:Metal ABC transporter permease n=1 Tax=Paracoccus liaowanqingii TaxID=2560053 RepID=A0A4Z1CC02_9RHOB|nr:zinc ABC transporter substrate-binding protein [Paracoccus liaowanqingii]TGN62399.1 hypothetical protein E4L95_06885 [Paracoccus liaowanqingii]